MFGDSESDHDDEDSSEFGDNGYIDSTGSSEGEECTDLRKTPPPKWFQSNPFGWGAFQQPIKFMQWEKDYAHNPSVTAVPWLLPTPSAGSLMTIAAKPESAG